MTQYGAQGAEAERLAAGATRTLSVPVGGVRTQLLQAIRRLNLATTSEQYSVIEAQRGSRLRGLSLTPARMPVDLRVELTPTSAGCTVVIRVADRWGVPVGRNSGAVGVYANVFTEVLLEIDAALTRVDPNAAATFPPWWRTIPEQDVPSLRNAGEAAKRAEHAVQRRSSRLLDGPRSGPSSAAADSGLTTLSFIAPDSVAHIASEVVDGMLTAGQLIAASPGDMPAGLVDDVQSVVVRLEAQLANLGANHTQDNMTIYVTALDRPVITFLYQQASIRDALPVRLLMVCTTCRLEKVVNPDLTRMRERSRRVKVLSSSVGAVFGSHNVSPFILVGRLAQLKNNEPDFVCLRCQGIDADQRPITFCPRCGERRSESVLRRCSKCELDLRTLLPSSSVWQEIAAAPPDQLSGTHLSAAAENATGDPPATTVPPPRPAPPRALSAPMPSVAPPTWTAPPAPGQLAAPANPGPWAAPAGTPYDKTGRGARRPAATAMAPGWHADPWRRHEIRYWDGRSWTAYIASAGITGTDPPG